MWTTQANLELKSTRLCLTAIHRSHNNAHQLTRNGKLWPHENFCSHGHKGEELTTRVTLDYRYY